MVIFFSDIATKLPALEINANMKAKSGSSTTEFQFLKGHCTRVPFTLSKILNALKIHCSVLDTASLPTVQTTQGVKRILLNLPYPIRNSLNYKIIN